MRNTTKSFIDALTEECEALSLQGIPVSINNKSIEDYLDKCSELYESYKKSYMTRGVTSLDRHKIAAILVVEAIANDLIKTDESKIPAGMISIAQEKVVLKCAFRYIQREFNTLIKQNYDEMVEFVLPRAFSPQANYIDIMCRIQLHSKKYYNKKENIEIALMDLADRFFLLEYISIMLFYGMEKANEIFEHLRSLHEH